MATITVNPIASFDATQSDYVVSFSYYGAQCIYNKIEVFNNTTNANVYTNTTTIPTYSLNHTIPVNTLSNGSSYTCQITAHYYGNTYSYTTPASGLAVGTYYISVNGVSRYFSISSALSSGDVFRFNIDTSVLSLISGSSTTIVTTTLGSNGTNLAMTHDVESVTSSKSNVWYCLAVPTFEFAGMTSGSIVTNSTFDFTLSYTQSDGEILDEYIVVVKTSSGTEFFNSGSQYPISDIIYAYTAGSGGLQAGTYNFTANGVTRYFSLSSSINSGDSLRFKLNTSILTCVSGTTTTTIETTVGSSGTSLSFSSVIQAPVITISGFSDDRQYSIRAAGLTDNGLEVDTGNISFSVNFSTPSAFGILTVENLKTDGKVKVSSNIATVTGEANFENVSYIADSAVDLRGDGHSILFQGGYDVSKSGFVMECRIYDITSDKSTIAYSSGTAAFVVSFHCTDFGSGSKFYGTLKQSENGRPAFMLMSNQITPPSSTDIIHMFLKYDGKYYTFVLTNLGVS